MSTEGCDYYINYASYLRNLGVEIDTNLNLQYQVNDLSIKLNISKFLLFKMRKYVSLKILRSIFLLFLTPTYLTAFLFGLKIVSLFNQGIPIPVL